MDSPQIIHTLPQRQNYCPIPYSEVFVRPDGTVLICCDTWESIGNIHENTIDEIFNGPKYLEIRQAFDDDQRHPICSKCWYREDNIGGSFRTNYLEGHSIHTLSGGKTESWQEFVSFKPHIRKFKVDFSNACNMRCPMCNISRSTGWIKDHKAMKDFLNDSGDQDFDQYDSKSFPFKTDFAETKQQLPISFIDDNWEHFLNANLIDLSGGEPFYMPQAIYLLEKLADSDYSGKLKIITNASLIEPYIDLLSNFDCQLVISCDGIDELYPIMRPTTSKKVLTWEHFESIMRKLKDNKINHGHSFVPQLANIHHLERWLDWCRDFYSDRKTNAIALPLYRPNWMRIEHYPDEEFKHNLADRLEKRNDILEFDNFNIEATIGQLRMKGDPVQYERFLAYMAKLDEIRNTNFMAIWAENT